MKFASASTTQIEFAALVADLTQQVRSELGPAKVDWALLFAPPQLVDDQPDFPAAIRQAIGARHLIGCTAAAVIGNRQEFEKEPAVTLLAAQLPDVEVTPFHLTPDEITDGTGPAYWHFQLDVTPDANPNLILLADPFSTQAAQLLQELGSAYPQAPIIGGLASGGRAAGECRLFVDDEVFDEGAVGVALSGAIQLRTIVAQGCRPIGQPMTITRADKNIIFELAGQTPLAVLQNMLPHLPAADQKLARTALFLGRVINEYQEDFGRGDFLIRNLIGHDPSSGAVAVGDLMRTGQTVQFQVRDGSSADEDLRSLLETERKKEKMSPVHGALLISCLGRGEGMFGQPNHDITAVQDTIGPLPACGFFANGEIGPVQGQPFVHGFTSVIGLFAEPADKPS